MKQLKVLCLAVSEGGHMNATTGVAIALKKRGHKVVFAVERSWQGKLVKYGIEEAVYDEKEIAEKDAGKQWSDAFQEFQNALIGKTPTEKISLMKSFFPKILVTAKYVDPQLRTIVTNVKPDVIVEDYGMPFPALLEANVPIVKLYSIGPLLAFDDDRLPPFGCGLPLNDTSDWERCREMLNDSHLHNLEVIGDWLKIECPNYSNISKTKLYRSTNLNIVIYPKALVEDYLKLCPLTSEYVGIDHCLREPFGDFEVPEQLLSRPGKLIYLSLGSWGSSFVDLMKRLISILSKSRHSFIVSKGHRHHEYELADNMWGEQFVPQLAILPKVDLVMTHGGNNSFIETVYFGKPMIVLPLIGDQHDNAQRAVEAHIGLQFDPFTVDEATLNNGIETLLSDSIAYENVERISREVKASTSMDIAVSKIEHVAESPKFPTIE